MWQRQGGGGGGWGVLDKTCFVPFLFFLSRNLSGGRGPNNLSPLVLQPSISPLVTSCTRQWPLSQFLCVCVHVVYGRVCLEIGA